MPSHCTRRCRGHGQFARSTLCQLHWCAAVFKRNVNLVPLRLCSWLGHMLSLETGTFTEQFGWRQVAAPGGAEGAFIYIIANNVLYVQFSQARVEADIHNLNWQPNSCFPQVHTCAHVLFGKRVQVH